VAASITEVLTVWYNLYAERLPELRPRAAGLLAEWPPP
jgi:hypothetical protein